MKKNLYAVAVDGSEWAERAVAKAVKLAQDTHAEVHLLTVIPWSGFQPLTLEEMAHRPLEKHEEEKHAKDDILAPLLEEHKDKGVKIFSHSYWGHPAEIIHNFAKEEKASMIFVGRRGRSRVADLLLGSVANSLAHTAGVPVVLVP